MQGTASDAGTAYQWVSERSTLWPQRRPSGATITITDMALSIRSTEMARAPERRRTMSTTDVIRSSDTVATAASATGIGACTPVTTPPIMAHPIAYIVTIAAVHSQNVSASPAGARRAACHELSNAGVV